MPETEPWQAVLQCAFPPDTQAPASSSSDAKVSQECRYFISTSLNLGFAYYCFCLKKLEHFLSSQLRLSFTITTAANTISSLNWRPASSFGIAKEIKKEAIGSDSGDDSGSDTSQSPAPAAWITEIQQNELFRKVRQKIENWEKVSELCGWTSQPKLVTWKLRILMMFY